MNCNIGHKLSLLLLVVGIQHFFASSPLAQNASVSTTPDKLVQPFFDFCANGDHDYLSASKTAKENGWRLLTEKQAKKLGIFGFSSSSLLDAHQFWEVTPDIILVISVNTSARTHLQKAESLSLKHKSAEGYDLTNYKPRVYVCTSYVKNYVSTKKIHARHYIDTLTEDLKNNGNDITPSISQGLTDKNDSSTITVELAGWVYPPDPQTGLYAPYAIRKINMNIPHQPASANARTWSLDHGFIRITAKRPAD